MITCICSFSLYAVSGKLSFMIGPAWNQFESSLEPSPILDIRRLSQISLITPWNFVTFIAGEGFLYFNDYVTLNAEVNGSFTRFGRSAVRQSLLRGEIKSNDVDEQYNLFQSIMRPAFGGFINIPLSSTVKFKIYGGGIFLKGSQMFNAYRMPRTVLTQLRDRGGYVGIGFSKQLYGIEIFAKYLLSLSSPHIRLTENISSEIVIYNIPSRTNILVLAAEYPIAEYASIEFKITYAHLKNRRNGTSMAFVGNQFISKQDNLERLLNQQITIVGILNYLF